MNKTTFQLFHQFMLAATAVLFGIASSIQLLCVPPSLALCCFLGGGTFLAYRISVWAPYLQFSPFKLGFNRKPALVSTILLIAITLIPLLWLQQGSLGAALIMGIISCFYFIRWGKAGRLKSGLRSIPLVKNVLLAGTWSLTTVWFPCHAIGWTEGTWYLFTARFIYILVICFAVDLRDIEMDKKQNIQTLPVLFGYKKIQYLCVILLMLFCALTFFKPARAVIPCRSEIQVIALILSSLLTAITILLLKKDHSSRKFSLLLDGNMFLQALVIALI